MISQTDSAKNKSKSMLYDAYNRIRIVNDPRNFKPYGINMTTFSEGVRIFV
jgi:hypothetical protein